MTVRTNLTLRQMIITHKKYVGDFGGEGGIRPAALGQCRRQPGELGNDTLYRFRPSRGRSLRVPFPNHHFNKNIPPFGRIFLLERVMGLEPTISAWKANVLPLHYTRVLSCKWCGRRDLNSYALRHWNLNPARLPIPPRPHERRNQKADGNDPLEIRTPDTLIKSQVLYRLS